MRNIGTIMYPGGEETATMYIAKNGEVVILGVFDEITYVAGLAYNGTSFC
jgi:hypothetical protein